MNMTVVIAVVYLGLFPALHVILGHSHPLSDRHGRAAACGTSRVRLCRRHKSVRRHGGHPLSETPAQSVQSLRELVGGATQVPAQSF